MQSDDRIPAMILAGGRARRMGGGDKSLCLLAGKPLLAHVLARLAPQVGALALNANGDPARFATFGLPVVADSQPEQPGPLAGVLAAMDWAAAQGSAAVLTVAADTPFFPVDMVARLRGVAGPIALAASPDADGRLRDHPAFALWPVALGGTLRAALERGERRLGHWARAQGAVQVAFDATPFDPFFNINTPEDLVAAEALARQP